MGNGDGTFQRALNYAVAGAPQFAVVADFNNDGKPDVAVANYTSNSISLLINTTP
jgi:hypothetical protein